ncbi:hypothetical protein DH2020_021199 [Rehmannia glutinosa]|uniref:DUF4283 domain-containing protein n=1 Tax=Rehmannia glutinosa TaxID=99300 RepID=A0ABR0WE72_REHGL
MMEPNLSELSLHDEEEEGIFLDEDEEHQINQDFSLCLIGRFLTEKGINTFVMKNRLANIWRPSKGINIKEIGAQHYLFRFYRGGGTLIGCGMEGVGKTRKRQRVLKWVSNPIEKQRKPRPRKRGMVETTWHLFVNCPFSVSVWRVAGMGDLVEEWAEGNESVMDFVANCLLCMDEWKKAKCLMVLWSLWRERNNEFWNNVHASAKETLHAAVNYLTEWCATNFGSGTEKTFRAADPCAQTAKWSKPNRLQFKCNVDATLSLERNATGIGKVVRDDKGEFVVARTITFPGIFAPKEAEAIEVREALSWIK